MRYHAKNKQLQPLKAPPPEAITSARASGAAGGSLCAKLQAMRAQVPCCPHLGDCMGYQPQRSEHHAQKHGVPGWDALRQPCTRKQSTRSPQVVSINLAACCILGQKAAPHQTQACSVLKDRMWGTIQASKHELAV